MPIKVKRVRRKQDVARAVDLAARVFSTYFVGAEQWSEMLRLDPGYAPGQTFVVERDGEFVSHARVTLRHVRLGQQVGLLGGIGDVATHPAHRGRGYGSACLEEAIRFMDEAGCCVSMLGTGRFSFYGRLGWEIAVPNYRVQVSAAAVPAGASDRYGRRRFRLDQDLPAVMALYDDYHADRLLSVVRDEDYWRRQMEFSMQLPAGGPWGYVKEDPEGFIVITDTSKSVVAYARSRYPGETHEVVEAAARDRRAALALLAHLAERYRERREMVLEEPPDSLLADVALTECGAQCAFSRSGTMVRIIDVARLFRVLAPELGARLQASELAASSGALRLKTEIGSATLEWDRGEVSVSRARRGPRLEMPYRKLTQLIAGYRSPASVLEQAGLVGEVGPAQTRALEVLFPRRFPHMRMVDRF